ncbi:PREDICTED: uncharacterized protein LOC106297603 [Brassica oleracea var. oleracea]|uniref:uncharacterized protein LOC106297603 n=1 Tax=Brassica oleracea var. oleracea TaxID=109376 RepID=UPI0006A7100E|nr:PREDICTED: uncharacterized protein LOC106297603 [Brassica oleracea var. oleracea]
MGIRAIASVASAVVSRKKTHQVKIYNMIETALEDQRSKMTDTADVPLWKQKEDTYRPQFSNKRTWSLIRQVHPTVQWHFGIWFQYATPKKSAFYTWLAIHKRLIPGDRMAIWNSGRLKLKNTFSSIDCAAEVWSLLTRGLLGSRFYYGLGRSYSPHNGNNSGSKIQVALFISLFTPYGRREMIYIMEQRLWSQALWFLTVSATGHRNYEALLQRWFASRV